MKHKCAIIAAPLLLGGTIMAGSTQASAHVIDPEKDYRTTVVVAEPGPSRTVRVDDTVAEVLQTSAGAVGGAGLAIAVLWSYRRRHSLVGH